MADARMPDRFLTDRRFTRLDDAHFRSYVVALMWAVNNRTDGEILPGDLDFIPGFRAGSAAPLVASGLWEAQPEGWHITDYADTQTTRSEFEALAKKRQAEREKKARQRASAASKNLTDVSPGDGPGDTDGDMSRGLSDGLHRQGKSQARTGTDAMNDEEDDWDDRFGASSVPWDPQPERRSA